MILKFISYNHTTKQYQDKNLYVSWCYHKNSSSSRANNILYQSLRDAKLISFDYDHFFLQYEGDYGDPRYMCRISYATAQKRYTIAKLIEMRNDNTINAIKKTQKISGSIFDPSWITTYTSTFPSNWTVINAPTNGNNTNRYTAFFGDRPIDRQQEQIQPPIPAEELTLQPMRELTQPIEQIGIATEYTIRELEQPVVTTQLAARPVEIAARNNQEGYFIDGFVDI